MLNCRNCFQTCLMIVGLYIASSGPVIRHTYPITPIFT